MPPRPALPIHAMAIALTLALALALGAFPALSPGSLRADPAGVRFTPSADTVDVHDYLEVEIEVDRPDAANPFTDVTVEGQVTRLDAPPAKPSGGAAGSRPDAPADRRSDPRPGAAPLRVEGFCDSPDGRTFRIRFLPVLPGQHRYAVRFRQGAFERSYEGAFLARDGGRRGIVRVDPEHPWHFVWSGSGERYFYNGTTTYWLLGWDDETIRRSIDRLHSLQVNRIRVVLNGRVKDGRAWYENVFPTERFRFTLNPWVAARPDDVENPGFDVRRFDVEHWRKYERLLRHARERDVVVSVVFHVDGRRPGVDPFGKERMGGEDEERYYRYAVARLAAFSNVMWDVTNEYHLFRTEAWTEKMGALIEERDPYAHLTSVHGHGDFPFRASPWADFAMYQAWDEGGGHAFLLRHREAQARTGRPMPQVNEEYGYEDHYPRGWGGNRVAPARSAENRRRLAWGMYLAGGYQTTGERADRGTGWGPDTGGGWINGRGDETMVMLEGYGRIVDFFTTFDWWRLEPDPGLVEAIVEGAATSPNGEPALRTPGGPDPERYLAGMRAPEGDLAVVYFSAGGSATLRRDLPGLAAAWFDPRSGEWTPAGILKLAPGARLEAPDDRDWALLLSRDVLLLRDTFRRGLAPGWVRIREDPEAWRATPDGLELRVLPGNLWGPANDARNVLFHPLPDVGEDEIEATAGVLNRPTREYEQVDLVWYHDDSHMVKIGQELVDGRLSIVMGREEGDRTRTIAIVPIASPRVELRLRVKDGRVRGGFRENASRPWTDAGECEVASPEAGKISIQAYQGPAGVERWARISDLKVRRVRAGR